MEVTHYYSVAEPFAKTSIKNLLRKIKQKHINKNSAELNVAGTCIGQSLGHEI